MVLPTMVMIILPLLFIKLAVFWFQLLYGTKRTMSYSIAYYSFGHLLIGLAVF
jgi:hypothetical protein